MDNINEYILRALEPDDLDILYDTENDKSLWKYSNTSSPFSKHSLKKFIENSHLDIIEQKQVRLVLSDKNNLPFVSIVTYLSPTSRGKNFVESGSKFTF